MDPNKVADHLKCPICFEIPAKEIYQCTNGHIICDGCCASLNACPECRLPYGSVKIRTRALEAVLDSMEFECFYKDKGCAKLVKRNELDNHIQNCSHGGKSLNLCTQIGYDCSFSFKLNLVADSLEHLQNAHDIPVCEEPEGSLCLSNFVGVSTKSMWTPVLVKTNKRDWDSPVFLVLSMADKQKKSVSWRCLFLGECKEDADKFQLKLKIQSKSTEMPKLNWKIPSVGCLQVNDKMKESVHKSGILSLLLLDYLSEGNLDVNFAIRKEAGKRVNAISQAKKQPLWLFNIPLAGNTTTSRTPSAPFFEEMATQIGNIRVRVNNVWEGVTCSGCHCTPITGNLYTNLYGRIMWYLCASCMDTSSQYSKFIFALVDTTAKKNYITDKLKSPYWKKMDLLLYAAKRNESKLRMSQNTVFLVTCDGCRRNPIGMVRYKCLQCCKYDLCVECFISGNHSDHIFAVVKNIYQYALLQPLELNSSPIFK